MGSSCFIWIRSLVLSSSNASAGEGTKCHTAPWHRQKADIHWPWHAMAQRKTATGMQRDIPFDQLPQMVKPSAATATRMQPPAPAHPSAHVGGTLARKVTIQGLRRRLKQRDLPKSVHCGKSAPPRERLTATGSRTSHFHPEEEQLSGSEASKKQAMDVAPRVSWHQDASSKVTSWNISKFLHHLRSQPAFEPQSGHHGLMPANNKHTQF